MKKQDRLADIALEDDFAGVRREAVIKLTDQEGLAHVAKYSKDAEVRIIAADKLNDKNYVQKVYIDIAKNDDNRAHREMAVKRITDQAAHVDILKNGKYKDTIILLENIIDQTVLVDIAMNAKSVEVAFKVAEKLTDQNLTQAVYAHIVYFGIEYLRASENQNTQAALKFNRYYSERVETCLEAIRMVTNQTALDRIIKEATNDTVRDAAIRKLEELKA